MQIQRKQQVKTMDLWGESHFNKPRGFLKLMKDLSKSTFIVTEYLYDYFSTETGRNKTFKIWDIEDLKNLTELSRSSILRAVDEIKKVGLFLVYEHEKGKNKTFGFYVKTKENLDLFSKLEAGDVNLKLKVYKFFEEVTEKVLSFTGKKIDSKMINSDSNLNRIDSEMNTTCSNLVKDCPNLNYTLMPENTSNTEFQQVPNTSQEYIKENYINNIYKETPKVITEIKPIQKTQEVEQIENKLKDIGIQNTKYLFNNFSLDVIKRQIDYFAYKDEYKKTAGALVNAIKIDEEAPEEFKREMIRIEHNNYKHKYRHAFREFASNVGVNKTTLQDHFFWNLTDSLNEIGLLDTNNSAQNQENKFKYDEGKFKTLEARIQKCLTDITYTDFLNLVDDCLKTFSNVPQIDKKHIFKREILNGNINTFNYKKALSKFNLNKSEVI